MKKKYITIIVVAIVAYVVWRKFGEGIKSTVTGLTK